MDELNSLNLTTKELSLPEGNFYEVSVTTGLGDFVGLARSRSIAMSICLNKVSDAIRNAYYEEKRARG